MHICKKINKSGVSNFRSILASNQLSTRIRKMHKTFTKIRQILQLTFLNFHKNPVFTVFWMEQKNSQQKRKGTSL